MYSRGFIKVAAASPTTKIGDAKANVNQIIKLLSEIQEKKASFALFPELCVCGYSAGDLVFQEYLYRDNLEAVQYLLNHNPFEGIAIIGTYFMIDDKIFNCCAVIQKDEILGIIPKSFLPHTNEFYESRWYVPGYEAECDSIELFGKIIPFGRLIFTNNDGMVQFGVEICEDYWAPFSPHEVLYANGAIIVFNSSASPEAIGKADKRSLLANLASYKSKGAYVYTSTNSSESTSEVIFSNHKMIYEHGEPIKDINKLNLDNDVVYGDIDILKLHHLRRTSSWVKNIHGKVKDICKIEYKLVEANDFDFEDTMELLPFVPKKNEELHQIIKMQAMSVKKRLEYIGIENTVVGISGGLDSTLALLSLCYMCDKFKMSRKSIIGVTLPTSNTSDTTYQNAKKLIEILGITGKDISIEDDVVRQLEQIEHDQKYKDVTYENIQARYRTFTLMNLANLHKGIVIGTSDMSEVALGWSTFNGDQMAMYGINSGIPKTVVKRVVEYHKSIFPEVADIIDEILTTPISPELTGIDQETESIIGKYEINDFILYHFLVNGDNEERIVFFLKKFYKLDDEQAKTYVQKFFNRFFSQQYKRITMPEGVKIMKLSLSRSELRLNGDIYKPSK